MTVNKLYNLLQCMGMFISKKENVKTAYKTAYITWRMNGNVKTSFKTAYITDRMNGFKS